MPGFLLHVGAALLCSHGASANINSANTRVRVSGQPVATHNDATLVAGCPFMTPDRKPQPCVKVLWNMPAARLRINGQPPLLQSSAGLCQSTEGIPQGPPIIAATQTRVRGI